jgi:hypothetical protein
MKARVPVLIKDPSVSQWKEVPLAEPFKVEDEDFFLDGPVTRRVAVVDFDPRTGAVAAGAKFIAASEPDGYGRYDVPMDGDLNNPAFVQAAVFGGVRKTLAMFEEPDTLGRRIAWGFGAPQLLVVPRAGDWPNAFYERSSHSLQFFYFTPANGGGTVYACQSQDIIAHETAHAVIDGVAPDIYDASAPQALAIHEAVADIATVLMAFRSRKLAAKVLEQTGGSIDRSNVFTAVAEQFATGLGRRHEVLRELNNKRSLRDKDLDRSEPHALSEVLSGALYGVMLDIYEEVRTKPEDLVEKENKVAVRQEYVQWQQSEARAAMQERAGAGDAGMVAAGRALFIAGERFKRTVLRGLDYLPPGELSFADFGRAVFASDEASHPESDRQRERLAAEFIRRGIIKSASEIDVKTNYEHEALDGVNVEELCRSDWAAYRFADRWRKLLGIPADIPFEVRPRLDVAKTYYHRGKPVTPLRELIFKVAWTVTEPSAVGGGLPRKRRFTRGTTLAIDWEKKIIRAVVKGGLGAQGGDRDAFLAGLLERGELAIGESAFGPGGRPLRGVVRGDIAEGALRLRSTAHALHVLWER